MTLRSLSDDEIRQIGLIIESLDRSTFDYLQLEFGDVKLTIGKGAPPAIAPNGPAALPQAAPSSAPPAPQAPPSAAAPAPAARVEPAQTETVAIVAPLLGRFYARPEPGAPPFVSLGMAVSEETTVALIEVMKTFNAVPAGVRGVVTEICVQDAQFIECGQILFRVRPQPALAD